VLFIKSFEQTVDSVWRKRQSLLFTIYPCDHVSWRIVHFLPRCMQCRRGVAMRKLSVCLSVTRVDC